MSDLTVVPITTLEPSTSPRTAGAGIAIRETRCNTLLHRLAFGSSTGYTANLYKGCTHGCTYCYAPSLIHDEREWGRYVDVKVNAPEVLQRELRGLRKDWVFLSSASNPYQPVEARYRLTRRCLITLQRNDFPVSILTRSPLVLRDLDVLKKFGHAKVGMSITTVPVRQFEPGVPPLERRIATLKNLAKEEIPTFVSLAPVIPGIIMVDLERLFEDLNDAGVSYISFGVLRFFGYEESQKMFEAASGMTAAEALVGRNELVARLSGLVKRYGMEPSEGASDWRQNDGFLALDSFSDGDSALPPSSVVPVSDGEIGDRAHRN